MLTRIVNDTDQPVLTDRITGVPGSNGLWKKIQDYNSAIQIMYNDKKKLYYIAAPLGDNALVPTDRGMRYSRIIPPISVANFKRVSNYVKTKNG